MAEAEVEDLKIQFSKAAKHLESVTMKLDPLQLLEFYSYYKQATQGKCCTPRPGWFSMTARQKWDAWNGLGDMSQEDAMEKYVHLMTQLFPEWEDEANEMSQTSGWVAVSSMANEEPVLKDSEKKLSDWVREGDTLQVKQHCVDNINKLDMEGLGPIHWAADRGNLDMVKFLVSELKADIELKDQDGQTAMHYAASCGHSDIVKYLLERGASINVKDVDGATPLDMASDADIINLLS